MKNCPKKVTYAALAENPSINSFMFAFLVCTSATWSVDIHCETTHQELLG